MCCCCSLGWTTRLGVLTLLGLNLLLAMAGFGGLSLAQLVLDWQPYTPKYIAPAHYEGYDALECYVNVPSDHFGTIPGALNREITLRVRRFTPRLAHPSKQVWVIPGGPGIHSNLVEDSIGECIRMSRLVDGGGGDTEWIFMDHRGTGKSSQLASSKTPLSEFWTSLAVQSPIPLPCYSPQNASMDLVTLAWARKRQAGQGVKVYGIGTSYGTFVLDIAAQLEPLLFDGLMFDGYSGGIINIDGSDIGHHLQSICSANPECRVLVEDVEGIPSLMARLQQARNSCVQSMMQWASPNKLLLDSAPASLRSFVKTVMECPGLPMERRVATLLALLTHSEACTHPGAFSRALNYLRLCREESSPRRPMMLGAGLLEGGRAAVDPNVPLKDASKCKSSVPLYSICFWSARVALEMRLPERQLPVVNSGAFISELDRLHQLPAKPYPYILPHLHVPLFLPQEGHRVRQVRAASIVVLASRLDTQTLHDDALRLLNQRISSRVFEPQSVNFFSLDYAKHVSLSTSGCAGQLFALLLDHTEKSQQRARECVKGQAARTVSYLAVDDRLKVLWPAHRIFALEGKLMPNMLALIEDRPKSERANGMAPPQTPRNQSWHLWKWVILDCGVFISIACSLPVVHSLVIFALARGRAKGGSEACGGGDN